MKTVLATCLMILSIPAHLAFSAPVAKENAVDAVKKEPIDGSVEFDLPKGWKFDSDFGGLKEYLSADKKHSLTTFCNKVTMKNQKTLLEQAIFADMKLPGFKLLSKKAVKAAGKDACLAEWQSVEDAVAKRNVILLFYVGEKLVTMRLVCNEADAATRPPEVMKIFDSITEIKHKKS